MNHFEWLVHLSGDEDHVHHRMWLTEKVVGWVAQSIFILAGLFVSVHLLGVASIAVAAEEDGHPSRGRRCSARGHRERHGAF